MTESELAQLKHEELIRLILAQAQQIEARKSL
jgi:hypothetical protein